MIEEIRTEFDVIRIGLGHKGDKNYSKGSSDRIVIMPLRKLLCDKNH